jgi:hypothetical protein
MLSQSNKSAFRVAHHDFDNLESVSGIEAYPARNAEIAALATLARATVPGVTLSDDDLAAYCRINPNTAFTFARNGQLLGGIAFLYLNDDGLDALILDAIDLRRPQLRLLAQPDEVPAAIYWWALAAKGRGIGGLGEIARVFASPQYRHADFYTQPSSEDGRRIVSALGFERMPSWQADLRIYRRAANREAARSEAHLLQAA